jgi:hypothetical protein
MATRSYSTSNERTSQDLLQIEEGSVYPAKHLEREVSSFERMLEGLHVSWPWVNHELIHCLSHNPESIISES